MAAQVKAGLSLTLGTIVLLGLTLLTGVGGSRAQTGGNAGPDAANTGPASQLFKVPMVNNIPGAVSVQPEIANPVAGDASASERGMRYFVGFNCVGCHAPNGGGGMGPALSDPAAFKYGTNPATLFLVIMHGAPEGMPSWGALLPE